jgi:hypothetical protein
MRAQADKHLAGTAEDRIISHAPRFADTLRSTISMNGAGIAGTLALLQVAPRHLGELALFATPFVLGLLAAVLSWIFTFTNADDDPDTQLHNASIVGRTVALCAGLFVVGLISIFGASLYIGLTISN